MKDPASSLAQACSLPDFEADEPGLGYLSFLPPFLPLYLSFLCPTPKQGIRIPQVPNSQMFISVFEEWCGIFKEPTQSSYAPQDIPGSPQDSSP